MDETNQDGSEVLETTENVAEETTQETPEVQDDVVQLSKAELEDLQKKAAERDELEKKNKQLFARTQKAKESAAKEGDFSGKDILALSSAGITNEEDIEVVSQAAKAMKLSIAEATKNSIVLGILKGKQEERTTANSTSTSNTRRVPIERTGKQLLEQAQKGNLPDPKDLSKLIRARIGIDK